MLRVRRIDRTRLDERDRDGCPRILKLHAEGVGEPLHGVLARRLDALEVDRALGEDAADVNEGTAALFQVLRGFE